MKRTRGQLEASAYHEAGHVVVAREMGLKIIGASIVPDQDGHGWAAHADPLRGIRLDLATRDKTAARVEKCILVSMAGAIAQRKFRMSSWRNFHGQADRDAVAGLLLRVHGDPETRLAYWRYLQLVAAGIVDQRWWAIEAVARALVELGTLNSRQIGAAIAAYLTDRLLRATEERESPRP
jgi:hypothetical protein